MNDAQRSPTDAELAALADARHDLVDAAFEEALLEALRDESVGLSKALRAVRHEDELDSDEVDGLVRMAMAKAVPESMAISREGLRGGLVGGLVTVLGSSVAWLALQETLTAPLVRASGTARLAFSLGASIHRLVEALPGGWTLVGMASLAMTALLVGGARVLDGRRAAFRGAGLAATLLALGLGGRARAYEIEGAWPSNPPISVEVVDQPVPLALEAIARASGMGLVYDGGGLPGRHVSLRAEGVSLREVLDAVLLDAPVTVRNTGRMLVVRDVPGRSVRVALSPIGRARVLRDVVTLGDDVAIRADQEVRDVVTMGGDARIDGQALGNVVTAGGDADVRGVVVGDVVTMGGDIRLAPGAVVHGQLRPMGGRLIEVRPESSLAMPVLALATASATAEPSSPRSAWMDDVRDMAAAATNYALVFLVALLLAFAAPDRFGAMLRAIRTQPARAIGGGALGWALLPFVLLVLVVTILGIPVALVLGAVSVLVGAVGLAVVSVLLGEALPIRMLEGRPVWRLTCGVGLLFLATRVPVLGWLVFLVALAVGTGAVLVTRFGRTDTAR